VADGISVKFGIGRKKLTLLTFDSPTNRALLYS